MKTKDFKELCAVYTAEPNLDNENMLLRTMAFDTKYFVAYRETEGGASLRMIESEAGEVILSVYTTMKDIDDNTMKRLKIAEMTFDEIVENVNLSNVDYVVINPNAEALTLTSVQLAKLYREKYYADFSYPLSLTIDEEFKARAMRLSEVNLKVTSKKLIEIYSESQNEKDESKRQELLNSFLDEFINHTKFYTPVLPDGETDSIGNLVVGKDRVIYMMNDGIKGEYQLYVDASQIEKNIEIDPEKTFVSVFDFADYITMMDAAHGVINGLKIIGDLYITIPASDVYYYNAIREQNQLLKDATILKGSYAPSEETDNIEKELNEYFNSQTSVAKIWLGREVELYKNGKNAFVYTLVLKLKDDKLDKEAAREMVRRILENRPFKMYATDKDVTDTQLKLVYENNTESTTVKEEKEQPVIKEKVKKTATEKKETAKKATTKTATKSTTKTVAKKTTKK